MIFPVVQEIALAMPYRRVVTVAARVLKFTRQAYYKWLHKPVSARQVEEDQLVAAIRRIHGDDPEFGYRLICDELGDLGFVVSEGRVWRLCHKHQVFSAITRKGRGKTKPASQPAEDDLVGRDFTAGAPNRVWLTDITEHKTAEGKLYLCAVKDLFSNRIVGWSIDSRMKAGLAVAALTDAWLRRGRPEGVIAHSDRGSQFGSRKYIRACQRFGVRRSMGQAYTCADNAAMESFFALLQKNVLNQQKHWPTRAGLRLKIVAWIEGTYNRRRRQRRLGKLAPVGYEAIHTDPNQLTLTS
jgi:transposase InsO family protein